MLTNDVPKKVSNVFINSDTTLEERLNEVHLYKSNTNLKIIRENAKELWRKTFLYYDKIGFNVNNAVYNFILEPLKNANLHSIPNQEHDILVRLMLSPHIFLIGLKDGGAYFKNKEVKRYWEMKKHFPEKNIIQEKQIGFGNGTRLIYDMADFIHIENSSGAAYLGLSVRGKYFHKKDPI